MVWSADFDAGWESSKVNWRPNCPPRTAFQLDYAIDQAAATVKHKNEAI